MIGCITQEARDRQAADLVKSADGVPSVPVTEDDPDVSGPGAEDGSEDDVVKAAMPGYSDFRGPVVGSFGEAAAVMTPAAQVRGLLEAATDPGAVVEELGAGGPRSTSRLPARPGARSDAEP